MGDSSAWLFGRMGSERITLVCLQYWNQGTTGCRRKEVCSIIMHFALGAVCFYSTPM